MIRLKKHTVSNQNTHLHTSTNRMSLRTACRTWYNELNLELTSNLTTKSWEHHNVFPASSRCRVLERISGHCEFKGSCLKGERGLGKKESEAFYAKLVHVYHGCLELAQCSLEIHNLIVKNIQGTPPTSIKRPPPILSRVAHCIIC